MLVLTRKLEEVLWVGDDVRIKIIKVRGNRVGLLIDAPPSVRILRDEIKDKGPNDKPPTTEQA